MPTLFSIVMAVCSAGICSAEVLNFETAKVGVVPAGWTVAMTHTGSAPKWEVRGDDSAPSRPSVLARVSIDRTAGRFPLAIWDGTSLKGGIITVKFKGVSGTVDQGAGLVWRYPDPDNYYIVRANALDENVVIYNVQNVESVSLALNGAVSNSYGVKRVPKQTWSTLSVASRGNVFTVSLDGETLFDVVDSTFPGGRKTGLWTKSDSVIYFDDFQVVAQK